MLTVLIPFTLGALAALPPVQEVDEEPRYDPAVIEAATAELDKVFATRLEGAIVSALLRHKELEHPDVIARVAKALGNRKSGVRRTAVHVLRFMEHEDALEALVRSFEEDARLRRDADLAERTLRAIGQHAEPSTFELYAEPPFPLVEEGVVRARIRGLGWLRERRSVELLMKLLEGGQGWKVLDHVEDLRVTLFVLTGVDRGRNPADWTKWWAEHGEEFELPEDQPLLPRKFLIDWCTYWELSFVVHEPEGRRRRRGDDEADDSAGDR